MLFLGGGFSFFGATTTVLGGFIGRSPPFWANALPARSPVTVIANIVDFSFNIEFSFLLMLSVARMGGRVKRCAAALWSKNDASKTVTASSANPCG